MSNGVQSRRWVRIDAEVVTAEDFTRVGGRILDLGADGARIQIDQRVVVGERLFMTFELPQVGMIDAEAVVAAIETDDQGARVIEVKLDVADETVLRALQGRLSKIPPVIPRSRSYDTFPATPAADVG